MGVVEGPWKVRCRATAKSTGEPCKLWAIRGAAVCRLHGAGGRVHHPDDPRKPNARTNAAERIMKLRERMLSLGDLAVDAYGEVLAGYTLEDGTLVRAEPKDRLKAADSVLDRFVPRTIEVRDATEDHRDIDEEIEAELERLGFERGQQETG